MNNFYEVLEVDSGASAETIKKNYRRLSKKYHPDLNQGDKTAEKRFKEINEAYSVLSSAEKRLEYDKKNAASAEKQQYKTAEKKQKTQPDSMDGFDIGNVRMQFGNFFGFDPKSKTKNVNFDGGAKNQSKNPLDTSDIFEDFFKPKKK